MEQEALVQTGKILIPHGRGGVLALPTWNDTMQRPHEGQGWDTLAITAVLLAGGEEPHGSTATCGRGKSIAAACGMQLGREGTIPKGKALLVLPQSRFPSGKLPCSKVPAAGALSPLEDSPEAQPANPTGPFPRG